MNLRHFTEFSGRKPSAAKRASYLEARKRFGMYGVLPEELPAGSTWVEPYSWGGEGEEPTMAQLEIGIDARDDETPSPIGGSEVTSGAPPDE
jgi:hypothetical protein